MVLPDSLENCSAFDVDLDHVRVHPMLSARASGREPLIASIKSEERAGTKYYF